jgi:hypothetical protein
MLTYCKKWYPETTSVEPYKTETITFYAAGNTGSYTSTRQSYECVKKTNTCDSNIATWYQTDYFRVGTYCVCTLDDNAVSYHYLSNLGDARNATATDKSQCQATCAKTENCLPAGSTCIDSDSGKNYYSTGYIYVNGKRTVGDYCATDGKTLHEIYLDSDCHYSTSTYVCPNRCEEGECK